MKRCGLIAFCLVACLLFVLVPGSLLAVPAKTVYVIPIKDTIDPGLAKFVARSYQEAEELKADMVLLEIDTPGGRIDAALEIRNTIRNSTIPTTALVKGGAISAGSLITLASKTIAMQPGATIGDAEPRSGTQRADEKVISYWAKEMAATAEVNGRNPEIAVAMADRDVSIPGLVEKGKLLTLTYQEAARVGYSDYTVNDRTELLTKLGFSDARIIEAEASASEKLTRFVTNPFVAPFLLTIGIAGIIIEFLTVGWGIAGVIGLVSLALYRLGSGSAFSLGTYPPGSGSPGPGLWPAGDRRHPQHYCQYCSGRPQLGSRYCFFGHVPARHYRAGAIKF